MKPETIIDGTGKEVVLIHFIKDGKIVCMPGLTNFASHRERPMPHMRSDERIAVTCPLCKRSQLFMGK